jgi:hypothetical protein
MTASLQLQQIIFERTSELEKYAQKPNANDYFIQKENAFLSQLTQIYNELGGSLIHQNLWQEVEEAWTFYQKSDSEFCGIALTIRIKPNGILHLLPLNFYEHGF